MSNRNYLLWLTLITAAAWGIRLFLMGMFIGFNAPIALEDGLDERDYEQFAYQMSVGNGFVLPDGTPSARRAPGTSLLIAPIYLFFGRTLLLARLWMAALSALVCPAVAWVIRPYGGTRMALIAAALCAFNPGLSYYALHLWSEAPYCLFIILATGCLMRSVEKPSTWWSIAAGFSWGAAILLRPQILLIIPCAGIGLLWLSRKDRQLWLSEFVRELLIIGALVAPWLIRNQLVLGAPTMTTLVAGHTFWGAHNELTFHDARYRGSWQPHLKDPTMTFPLFGSELQQDRQAWGNGWRCIRRNWNQVPQLLVWKIYRLITPFEPTANRAVYWAFAVSWIVTAPLLFIGLQRLRSLAPALFAVILAQFAAVLICSLIFYGAARFRHSLEPFFMIAVAAALVRRSPINPITPTVAGINEFNNR